MKFTYSAYIDLLNQLKGHGYQITDYHGFRSLRRCVILRHDIDFDIDLALKLAELEGEEKVSSTYFVSVTSEFYNVHSRDCGEKLRKICRLGHNIGVHYDETAHPGETAFRRGTVENIIYEGKLLSDIVGKPVTTVSMHRPSRKILESNLAIPGFVNSYSSTFFHQFKYVSDSGRKWREPVEQYIKEETYERLHILTHAFWYRDGETELFDVIKQYVNSGNIQRYDVLYQNFSALGEVMGREEIH